MKKLTPLTVAKRYYTDLSIDNKIRFDEYAGIFEFDNYMTHDNATIQAYLEMSNEQSAPIIEMGL